MSKAVMLSIRPKWCEKIISGEKTVEVRKTRPKLETPFKCYIYCTVGRAGYDALWILDAPTREEYSFIAVSAYLENPKGANKGNSKVIGEFICDRIYEICKRGIPENFDYCYLSLNEWGNDDIETKIKAISASCVSKEELNAYGAKAPLLYGWHISDLLIYDQPRELSEFRRATDPCDSCHAEYTWECKDCKKLGGDIKRPPQSWCYVEEG